MRAVAFNGAGNITEYTIQKDGGDFDLDAAGITKIEVAEKGNVISSDTGSVQFSGSTISFEWGALGLKPGGNYYPTIYAYRGAGDTKGEVIFGRDFNPIQLIAIGDDRL